MLLRCLGVAVLFSTLLAAADSVTYYGQIAPIVLQDCAPCHRPGESGPFSLLTYADVKKRAAQIVKVTGSRFMPPWLPESGYGEFKEERRLTDAQIKLFDGVGETGDACRHAAQGRRRAAV